ncbi:hypothetical protein TUMEXPCC7403_04435 [Tumidithrix helvetica PCC 7403]|uniref:hypothetical protein n=1 Tax=Tumidithrix helvetica TaxID=3457545 RepID=UPI003C80E233
MPSLFTQAQLRRLRPGDRVTYGGGVQWDVLDYSTYTDPQGYETEEWELNSGGNTCYYLLREVDPANPETSVNWYFSQEIKIEQVASEHPGDNLKFSLWRSMREGEHPHERLRALGRDYFFESKTTGTYVGGEKGATSRTTWDYWDSDRLWNLAIEAWEDGGLYVYSTKKVDPSDFSEIENSEKSMTSMRYAMASAPKRSKPKKTWQWVAAWSLTILGICLMLFGGW